MIRVISTNEYILAFNTENGTEVLTGINGNRDPFRLEFPSLLDIGIMGNCVNNCEFCYQGNRNQDNMKLEDFKKIIDSSKHHVVQVALGGKGDPNLHENFEEIVKYARDNDVVPNYTTSGNGLTDDHIRISKEYCGAVAVSMYDKDYTYSALNRLIKKEVKTNIHQIFSRYSYPDILSILNGTWKNLDRVEGQINAIILLLFKNKGNGESLDWIPTIEQLTTFSEMIKELNPSYKIGLDSCLVNKVSNIRELLEFEKLCLDTCEASRMSCYISSDLIMYPCSFGNKGVKIEDVNKEFMYEIWNGLIFNEIMQKLCENKTKCPYFT